ncbi:recombinase family protein [uncultured Ruminococcus sp.]|uniref:recombinase family protein n=1 Tax=uncultured Ruminococcus sp. TaxID=165186 RepID=UPI00262F78F1|nr:recombinase family protein [uncultured Ruminococcus sp.]
MTIKTIAAQPAEKKKLRVAAYCRVSTENDDQRDSLETQKAHFTAWIKMHSDWEFAGIFYGYLSQLKDNLKTAINLCNPQSAEALAERMRQLQQELLDRTEKG